MNTSVRENNPDSCIDGNCTFDHIDVDCIDDTYCKNLDLYNSMPGNLVYRCPNATCVGGSTECNCGPECVNDSRTGICVTPREAIGLNPTPGTLPPTGPGSSVVSQTPPSPPALNKCTVAQLGADKFACWKIVGNELGQSVVNCDPVECGLELKEAKSTRRLAGTDVVIYSKRLYEQNDKSRNMIIIGSVIGVIGAIVLIYFAYYMMLKLLAKMRKGKKVGSRFG
jgi:hypothetical protein